MLRKLAVIAGCLLVASALLAQTGTYTSVTRPNATTAYHAPATFGVSVYALAGTATGNVDFYADGSPVGSVTLQNGLASFTTSSLEPGLHTVYARYLGTPSFAASQSAIVYHLVSHTYSRTELRTWLGFITFGESAPFTVQVRAEYAGDGQPTGIVNLVANGVIVGSGQLVNGTAVIDATGLHGGASEVTANYAGDQKFWNSQSLPGTVRVDKAATSVDPRPRGPYFLGSAPAVSFVVVPSTGGFSMSNGKVTVREGASILLSQDVDSHGVLDAKLPPLAAGIHKLQASYEGSQDFQPSSASVTLNVIAPAISIHGVQVSEGNRGVTPIALPVTLSQASSATVRIAYKTLAGGATEGSDYEAASGVIEFAPGEVTKSIELHVLGDTDIENEETFSVVFFDPVNAVVDAASAVVVIGNDDSLPARKRAARH